MLSLTSARPWIFGAILTAFAGAATGCTTESAEPEACDEATGETCPGNQESLKGSFEKPGTSVEDHCVCADIYSPVCGDDGKTYGNACEAGCADIKVVHEGECKAPGDNEDCICPAVYSPVCGDDGKTYGNACDADCADIKVVHEGECGRPCQSDNECPNGWCEITLTCAAEGCPPPSPNRCVGCGDGSQLTCKALPGPCPADQVREIIDGCFGECVNRFSCTNPTAPCVVTGCSGETCSDEPLATTCEWRPEYACFRKASCERQAAGHCDWTETSDLRLCIENAKASGL